MLQPCCEVSAHGWLCFSEFTFEQKRDRYFPHHLLFVDTVSNKEFFNVLSPDFVALGHEFCFHQKPYFLLIEAKMILRRCCKRSHLIATFRLVPLHYSVHNPDYRSRSRTHILRHAQKPIIGQISGIGQQMTEISEVRVEPKMPWSAVIELGKTLTITDLEGQQAVDFLCYDADDLTDRFSATNTIKVQGNIYIEEGSVLRADSGKPLFTVVKDTVGRHDTIYGCCSNPNNMLRYGVETIAVSYTHLTLPTMELV